MLDHESTKLFENILRDFHEEGILQDFILIGSWALRVYSEHFDNHPQIPIVSTQDIDLLVPNPPKVSREVDVPALLQKYDLEIEYSQINGCMKYVGPDFEVEFLYADQGRGEKGVKKIDGLGISATPLRYMNFIQDRSETMKYRGIPVRVPRPSVFVLMKYLLVTKRTGEFKEKIEKDIETGKGFELFLLEEGFEESLVSCYREMPKPWRKTLLDVLRENKSELFVLLKDTL